jgi:hypothetical protein
MTPEQIEEHAEQVQKRDEHKGKWLVGHGCHRGALTSRDSRVTYHDSLEACREYIREQEAFYLSIGYMIWFAYAIAPGKTDKDRISLHRGNSYQ